MRTVVAMVIAILAFGFASGIGLPQTQTGEPTALKSIHMVDAMTGWAVTLEPWPSALLRTTDGGTHWRDVTPLDSSGHRIGVYRIAVLTSLIAWVPSYQRELYVGPIQIFHTVDGGQTWRNATIPAQWMSLESINFINAQNGWLLAAGQTTMGTNPADVYRTADGGETWYKLPGGQYLSGIKDGISFLNATTGWITGQTIVSDWTFLYITHDGGRTWRKQNLDPPVPTLLWNGSTMPPVFFGPRDGVLPVFCSIMHKSLNVTSTIGEVLALYLTHDGGATWKPTTPLPVAESFHNVAGREFHPFALADINHGWEAEDDVLHVTSDGGRQWTTALSAPPLTGVRQLDFISAQVGWAVRLTSPFSATEPQTPPFLLKTLDGGRTWAPVKYTISKQ